MSDPHAGAVQSSRASTACSPCISAEMPAISSRLSITSRRRHTLDRASCATQGRLGCNTLLFRDTRRLRLLVRRIGQLALIGQPGQKQRHIGGIEVLWMSQPLKQMMAVHQCTNAPMHLRLRLLSATAVMQIPNALARLIQQSKRWQRRKQQAILHPTSMTWPRR